MINIYAQTFMNATRTGCVRLKDVPSVPEQKRHRWFKRRPSRCINPDAL